MYKINIQFSNGSDSNELIELSRVPCEGEKIAFPDHAYEVNKVTHYINATDVIALVHVSGHRINGKYVSAVDLIPPMKL